MLLDRCLSCPVCLSVTLMCCGQTVGWIKKKLDNEVDGDPAPPKGVQPQFSAYV